MEEIKQERNGEVLDVYRSLIRACGLKYSEDGFIQQVKDGKTLPFMVKGRPLALPIDARLRAGGSEVTIFHPLVSNVMTTKETPVMAEYRVQLLFFINKAITIMMNRLIHYTSVKSEHPKFSPEQAGLLSITSNADEKMSGDTSTIITKIASTHLTKHTSSWVSMYVKSRGEVDVDDGKGGKTKQMFNRVGVVTFPIYKELKNDKIDTICGVKITNKLRKMWIAVIEYILPNIDKEGYYNRGSNSTSAAYLEAMLKSIIAVGSEMNEVAERFESLDPRFTDCIIDSDWVIPFQDIDGLYKKARLIPLQDGNSAEDVDPPKSAQQLGNANPPSGMALPNISPNAPINSPTPNQMPQQQNRNQGSMTLPNISTINPMYGQSQSTVGVPPEFLRNGQLNQQSYPQQQYPYNQQQQPYNQQQQYPYNHQQQGQFGFNNNQRPFDNTPW